MPSEPPRILDVRAPAPAADADTDADSASLSASMRNAVLSGLQADVKSLPTMLLYDERGLNIYDRLTTDAEEYYPFACEEEILKQSSDEIVSLLHPAGVASEAILLELGAGSLRKTSHILSAFASAIDPAPAHAPPITYYALDLEKRELDRTLKLTAQQLGDTLTGKVDARGMWGTYDDGLDFVRHGGLENVRANDSRGSPGVGASPMPVESKLSPSDSLSDGLPDTPTLTSSSSRATTPSSILPNDVPLYFMFLGSSLGNFDPTSAAEFLKSLPLRPGSNDRLLLGLDHDNEKELIEHAYNDRHGITREFILNGLKCAGKALGNDDAFDVESGKWTYFNFYNKDKRRHEAYYKSTTAQTLRTTSEEGKHIDIPFVKDELVHIEYSHKYSTEDAVTLFSQADLRPVNRWTDSQNRYSLWLLERPAFSMPLISPEAPNSFGLPALSEFQDIWKAWDVITLQMTPREMLHTKPIDLRHKCLFYLGHIPAFLDIHLSRFLQEGHTEPVRFKDIFERGIDPNVDDPTQCHDHSEVPQTDEEWPALEEVLLFRDRVRERLQNLYNDFETGVRQPSMRAGRVLSMTLEHEHMHAETLLYMLLQGVDKGRSGTLPPEGFSTPQWDLLKATEAKEFHEFQKCSVETTVSLGPTTITLGLDDSDQEDEGKSALGHNFGWDNESPARAVNVAEFRISWRPICNGEFYKYWRDGGRSQVRLPASWIEIAGEILVRTLYGPVPMDIAYHWPVMTSYDDLSTYARVQGGRLPTEPELRLFLDTFCNGYLGGANMGFRNWHPISATTGGANDAGRGHNGGVWEWTSTIFDSHPGFTSSELYPGYSSDFFDGHHYVVLGGSYATPPRIGQRRTFRNWYQHNYPYAWVGGRVAYDI